MNLTPGTLIDNRFKIVSMLGCGGLGSVYKASQAQLNRFVAIKFLHVAAALELEAEDRLRREALVLSKLDHANIVSFYGYGIWQSYPFIVLELVTGESLQSILEDRQPMPLKDSLDIAKQVAAALAYAHKRGVVHRDLKPVNIMVARNTDSLTTKVIDFGLAKLLPEFGQAVQKLTTTGSTVGTLITMSPEQCAGGSIDSRSDIYALGVVLHYCLTGQPPFSHDDNVSMMVAHIQEPPPGLHKVHATVEPYKVELQKLIYKVMAKHPEDRYQTAEELLDDLNLIESGKSLHLVSEYRQPSVSQMRSLSPAWQSGRRVPQLLVIGIASAFSIATILYVFFGNVFKSNTLVDSAERQPYKPSLNSTIALLQGNEYRYHGDYAGAARRYQEALSLATQSKSTRDVLKAKLALCQVSIKLGHWQECYALGLELEPSIRKVPYNSDYSTCLRVLAEACQNLQKFNEEQSWRKALRAYTKDRDSEAFELATYDLAKCYLYKHRENDAIRLFQENLAMPSSRRPWSRLAIGECYFSLGKYQQAVPEFQQALVELDKPFKHQDEIVLARLHTRLGLANCLLKLKKPQQARSLLEEIAKIEIEPRPHVLLDPQVASEMAMVQQEAKEELSRMK